MWAFVGDSFHFPVIVGLEAFLGSSLYVN
jgi:hypothetical protein